MPATYTSLLSHLIFSTKNRELLISPSWRFELYDYLGGTIRGLGGTSLGVGGMPDHVHLLIGLKPTHCLSDIMRDLKKASSKWVVESGKTRGFAWQEGYAAFSVSASGRSAVEDYIANQEEHHRHRTFREELVAFLEKHGVSYEDRYLD